LIKSVSLKNNRTSFLLFNQRLLPMVIYRLSKVIVN